MSSHGRAPGPVLPLVTHAAIPGPCHVCRARGPRRWTLQQIYGGAAYRRGGCVRAALCRHCLGVLPHRALV